MKELNKYIILLTLLPVLTFGQAYDSTRQVNTKRLSTFVIASSAAYSLTLAGLNQLWYSKAERQSFQFFNDNSEWKQVDKLGHFYSSFYLSFGTSRALQWCNIPAKKSDLIGAVTGFAVLLPIEVFDGFSNAYGASAGDLIANAAGASFYLLQSQLWKEVRLIPKFSFRTTSYASLRPNVLGDGISSEIFKDYNGQTYWLSVDVDKFIKFPSWLNIATGYGAHGMVYARDEQNLSAGFGRPYRQYYLALDFDFSSIKTRSKAVRTLLFFANMVKIPSPAIEFSRRGMRWHALHF